MITLDTEKAAASQWKPIPIVMFRLFLTTQWNMCAARMNQRWYYMVNQLEAVLAAILRAEKRI